MPARAAPGGRPLFEIERAAARYFGIHTYAAHVNGLVQAGDGVRRWLARRSPSRRSSKAHAAISAKATAS